MEIKHTFLLTLILGLAWAGLLFAYSTGPDPGVNGLFGETCTSCHNSFPVNSGTGGVSLSGLPGSWTPGQTYSLMVTVKPATGSRKYGFQLSAVAEKTSQQAGTLVKVNSAVQVVCSPASRGALYPGINCSTPGAIQFAEHTNAGTANTFTVNWTAPSSADVGTVRFNLAGNAANNDSNTTGDFIYTHVDRVDPAAPPPPDLSTRAFTIVDRGGSSIITDGGGDFDIGFSRIQPAAGSTTPTGVAIFGGRSNNVLFTEAGVPAAPLLRSARIYAEINVSVNTGLAIANPNSQTANITFHFATSDGVGADQTIAIPANSEIAKYLNESAFGLAAGATLQGTFTFSDVPVAVVALRLLRHERGE